MKERPNKCYDERDLVDRICQHMAYLFTYVYLERRTGENNGCFEIASNLSQNIMLLNKWIIKYYLNLYYKGTFWSLEVFHQGLHDHFVWRSPTGTKGYNKWLLKFSLTVTLGVYDCILMNILHYWIHRDGYCRTKYSEDAHYWAQ